jgi:Zn-dependent protease with chaperone function
MADLTPLYPPTPPGIPADLAKPGLRYRLHVVLVLLTLFLFLLIYLAFIGAACVLGSVVVLGMLRAAQLSGSRAGFFILLGIFLVLFAVPAMLVAFLVKGFFKRGEDPSDRYLEISQSQQPELFHFIHMLCQEIGCSEPARVYLTHEVNASVTFRTSILALVIPPPKNLLLGLGLVNVLDLVEFKALLAHEFGHFSQRSLRLSGYAVLAHRVLANMVYERDRWDAWVIRGFDTPLLSALAVPLYALVEGMRRLMKSIFYVLTLAHRSLLRQMELNADLVAVSVAGSDAPVHVLVKADFAQQALHQATRDLALAAEHGLWTRDVFFHQQRAAEFLRQAEKNPGLGQPPALPADQSLRTQVFQPESRGTAEMWADHPAHYDREQNAKRRYWRSPVVDHRTGILFRDAAALHQELTLRFYCHVLKLEPAGAVVEPEVAQEFIDEEHAASTFDARYFGVYDNRWLELEDFEQMLREVRGEGSPTPEQLAVSLRELYSEDLRSWAACHQLRREEFTHLQQAGTDKLGSGRRIEFRGQHYPASAVEELLAKVRAELEEDRGYLVKFDRSVFALHQRMAEFLGREQELCQRYRFHLQLQKLLGALDEERGRMDSVIYFLSSHKQLAWAELHQIVAIWRHAHEGLGAVLKQAVELSPPHLKGWKAGESLRCILPDKPSIPELDPVQTDLDFRGAQQLHKEVLAVLEKLNRIQLMSLGGLLAFQQQLSRDWSFAGGPATEAPDVGMGTDRSGE